MENSELEGVEIANTDGLKPEYRHRLAADFVSVLSEVPVE